MQNLIGPYYIKSYNPVYNVNSENNAFSQIKSMLLSRNVEMQNKATTFLMEALMRFAKQSTQRQKLIQHILSNDMVVFLCEAMATDHWPVLRSIIYCFKLLAQSPMFYTDNYAPYATASIIRTIYFYLKENKKEQVIEFCLNFISEIFYSVRFHKQTSALSQSSLYNVEQLFDFLVILIEQPALENKTKLTLSLVLHAVISYQPTDLKIDVRRIKMFANIIEKWLPQVCNTLQNNKCMMEDDKQTDLVYGMICHLGIDSLRLCGFLKSYKHEKTFIEKEILHEDDTPLLIVVSKHIAKTVYGTMIVLVSYTKDFHDEINDNDYKLFLKLLYLYFQEAVNQALLPIFSEHLAKIGYLTLLPRTKFIRNKPRLNELCTANLSEILSHLSRRYLQVNEWPGGEVTFFNDVKRGLMALSHDMESWPSILDSKSNNECTTKPFCILIFLYFHCLSAQSPQICSAPFLPFLVNHIMDLTRYKPPTSVVKCLWLVFAMSSISNTEWSSLEKRISLERAIGRFVNMISVGTEKFYTHHPVLVLWVYSSDRILNSVQCVTLTEWLQRESILPAGLSTFPAVWRTLVFIIQDRYASEQVLENATSVLKQCLEEADEDSTDEVGLMIWEQLGDTLSMLLLERSNDTSAVNRSKYLLEVATFAMPSNMPTGAYQRSAMLLAALLTRHIYLNAASVDHNFCFRILRLAFCLLNVAIQQDDTSVLQIFVCRIEFIQCVFRATQHFNEELSCTALRLLSYVVYFYEKYNLKGNKVIQLDPSAVLSVLRKEKKSSIRQTFLQLLYTILSNSTVTKTSLINLSTRVSDEQGLRAMRGIMFRLQMISCCESKEESANGMQTLNSLLKFAADSQKHSSLIISLVSQPWCHALVKFHMQQGNFTSVFLQFLKNWLICLKIIRRDKRKIIMLRNHSKISVMNSNSIFLKTFVDIERILNSPDVTSQLCKNKTEIKVVILNTVAEFVEIK